jgi:hypothetical protein
MVSTRGSGPKKLKLNKPNGKDRDTAIPDAGSENESPEESEPQEIGPSRKRKKPSKPPSSAKGSTGMDFLQLPQSQQKHFLKQALKVLKAGKKQVQQEENQSRVSFLLFEVVSEDFYSLRVSKR